SSSSEPKSSTSSSSSEPKSSTSSSSSTYESEPNPNLGIASFVDLSKDPWDYVERYKTEPNYKKWFDDNYSQYSSIFEAVGLPEPQENIPSWIKNTASRWAENQIDDGTFIQGIEFMLENDIILISEIPESASSSAEKIPNWVRSNAGWWSQNIISESEFTNSLKYLIEKGIIVIN
ncbi:MAG: hypothetical protein J4F36_13405, partial [Nitrosopumilaceae archaeon]|nr:hypothetical protein [Nitrosopumilaceae archaeon]